MRRVLYNIAFYTFALVLPIFFINAKFPITGFFEGSSTWYKISLGVLITVPFVFLFFRKRFVEWAKSFDRVTWLKGFSMWVTYVSPVAVVFLIVAMTAAYTEQFTFILGWSTLSYMIAGIFYVLLKKEKVEKFKKWVIE